MPSAEVPQVALVPVGGAGGPFSSAPPPAVPAVAPPASPAATGLFTAPPGFATDVDASSDLPFAPPVEAGDETVDDTRA
jgi:hypothetical protein